MEALQPFSEGVNPLQDCFFNPFFVVEIAPGEIIRAQNLTPDFVFPYFKTSSFYSPSCLNELLKSDILTEEMIFDHQGKYYAVELGPDRVEGIFKVIMYSKMAKSRGRRREIYYIVHGYIFLAPKLHNIAESATIRSMQNIRTLIDKIHKKRLECIDLKPLSEDEKKPRVVKTAPTPRQLLMQTQFDSTKALNAFIAKRPRLIAQSLATSGFNLPPSVNVILPNGGQQPAQLADAPPIQTASASAPAPAQI
eukprot:TRINITY_DN4845_c0_g1_i1.p2 TRINITY_DN4845_c0_g1~~TRINITY_DN4845_c0_g1_i1.p2  ORF type:complete len:251 (-),score=56.93 TRINITY_DN4845_c0_g1_i1:19-771(-)